MPDLGVLCKLSLAFNSIRCVTGVDALSPSCNSGTPGGLVIPSVLAETGGDLDRSLFVSKFLTSHDVIVSSVDVTKCCPFSFLPKDCCFTCGNLLTPCTNCNGVKISGRQSRVFVDLVVSSRIGSLFVSVQGAGSNGVKVKDVTSLMIPRSTLVVDKAEPIEYGLETAVELR